ncbi:PHP-associated domain-containing protein [Desulfococcaceae bacterium HSG9]|nr:PHP-associated domain-containing protein [Desulfococcaceae bacterium HSG9]
MKIDHSSLQSNAPVLTRVKIEHPRPYLKMIRENGFMIMDMHVHTRFSDSFTRVTKLIRRAAKLQIGLAITDHNEIKGVLRAFEIKKHVPIIPGIEISIAEGPHILVYFTKLEALIHFYEKHVKNNKTRDPHSNTDLTIAQLMHAKQQYKCLVSIAHPYAPSYANVPKNIQKGFVDPYLLDQTDAVEVLNGAVTRKKNQKAVAFAQLLGKGITGGSDSHSLFETGKVVTYTRAQTISEFLRAIKRQENFVLGKPIGKVKRMPSLAKSSHKHITYFFPTIQQRYEQVVARNIRYHKPIIARKMNNLKNGGLEFLKQPLLVKRRLQPIHVYGSDSKIRQFWKYRKMKKRRAHALASAYKKSNSA